MKRNYFERLLQAGLLTLAMTFGCAATAQLMNRAEPLAGITTSGQPRAEELRELAEDGYVAVVDLRTDGEDRGFDEKSLVESLGMSYVSLPVEGVGGVDYDKASALDAVLADIDGPVLVHCASSNRVGAVLSLREKLAGASSEAALQLGLDAGMSSPALRERVETLLGSGED